MGLNREVVEVVRVMPKEAYYAMVSYTEDQIHRELRKYSGTHSFIAGYLDKEGRLIKSSIGLDSDFNSEDLLAIASWLTTMDDFVVAVKDIKIEEEL